MSLTLKQFNDIEREFFKTIPQEELPDFIENYGERIRFIIENAPEETDQEILESLISGYRSL